MQRSFVVDALWSTLTAVGFGEVVLVGWLWWESGSGGGGIVANLGGLFEALLWLTPTAFIGACIGVALSSGMGWTRRWVSGAVVGALVVVAAIIWASAS